MGGQASKDSIIGFMINAAAHAKNMEVQNKIALLESYKSTGQKFITKYNEGVINVNNYFDLPAYLIVTRTYEIASIIVDYHARGVLTVDA